MHSVAVRGRQRIDVTLYILIVLSSSGCGGHGPSDGIEPFLTHLSRAATLVIVLCSLSLYGLADDIPHLEKKDGRFALIVGGEPFLMLGAQM